MEENDIKRPLPYTDNGKQKKSSEWLIGKMALFGFVFIPIGIAVFYVYAFICTQILPEEIARSKGDEAYAIEMCEKGQARKVKDLITKYAKEGRPWAYEYLHVPDYWDGTEDELIQFLHQEADKRNPLAYDVLLRRGDTYAIDKGLNMDGDYISSMAYKLIRKPEKRERTIELFEMAYERGSAKAARGLYIIYSNQQEIRSWPADSVLAGEWLERGAEMGYYDSMRDLSEYYETGQMGFKRDKDKAMYWKKRMDEDLANLQEDEERVVVEEPPANR